MAGAEGALAKDAVVYLAALAGVVIAHGALWYWVSLRLGARTTFVVFSQGWARGVGLRTQGMGFACYLGFARDNWASLRPWARCCCVVFLADRWLALESVGC
jgi:hypothetical protein